MQSFRVLDVTLLAISVALAHGQVKVLGPQELVKEFRKTQGIVYGTTATFGAPYYGERVLGRLVYGESQGDNHCSDKDYDIPKAESQSIRNGQELVNVVLVRRGGCTFVTKTLVAQTKGAHAVLVVDKESSSLTAEQIQKIVMADDGFGHKVTIPSILISAAEGQKLIKQVQKEPVIVELAWDIPRSQVVVADFWMSSGSQESAEFLERFQDSAVTLKYHLQFVPHFHTFSLPPEAGFNHLCADTIESCDSCKPSVGKYCAPDPDGPGPIAGGDVVNEDLRRLCIWNVTAKKQSATGATYSQSFWDYLAQKCTPFGYKCSLTMMEKAGIPADDVKQCVNRNYEEFLEKQLIEVAWSPQALRLNGWRYSGPLDPETVLKAMCSGFAKTPEECNQLFKTYSRSSAVGGGGVNAFFNMLMFMAAVVALLGVLFFFYRRHVTMTMRKALREEVMLEVQTQMADYVPMEDKGPTNRPALSF